jgi:2-polyprenyl-6-methoxyphenol hydroxylase-like FAD-dependent oxidoreductase
MREGDRGQQLLVEARTADATQKKLFSEKVFSHVIAADGKWSVLRAAAAALEQERQGQKSGAGVWGGGGKAPLSWTIHHEQTWGVQMSLPEMPENGGGKELVEGWRCDASHILYPKTLQGAIYALVMPLQDARTKQNHTSISLVCSDLLLDTHPWAGPLDSREGESWQAAAARPNIDQNFQKLIEAEFPHLLVPASCSPRFSVGKRSSWVEMDSFVACDGRVAFVGDAAHSMVPSLGEGCNTALESAVSLAHHVASAASASACSVSSADLSEGLQRYSAVRLPEAQEVQRKSALAARGMTNAALADLQKKSTKGDPSRPTS